MKKLTRRNAFLIYCTEGRFDEVYAWAKILRGPKRVKKNCVDPKIFRNMKNYVLIVTDHRLMRGVDYSVGPKRTVEEFDGICLYLMRHATG